VKFTVVKGIAHFTGEPRTFSIFHRDELTDIKTVKLRSVPKIKTVKLKGVPKIQVLKLPYKETAQ